MTYSPHPAGPNDGTRKAAAAQICEIAKAHPAQIVPITRKVGAAAAEPRRCLGLHARS